MSGTQLTDLTTIASPANDDILYAVHNPGAIPESGKLTIQNAVLSGFDDKGNIAVGTGASAGTMFPSGTDGQRLSSYASESCGLKWVDDTFALNYIISYPTSSTLYPAVECAYAGSISTMRMYAGTVTGSVTVDWYKMTYDQLQYTPGTAYSMVGTATKPSFSGTCRYEGTITTWASTTFSAGDWLMPYISSAGTITSLTISLRGIKVS